MGKRIKQEKNLPIDDSANELFGALAKSNEKSTIHSSLSGFEPLHDGRYSLVHQHFRFGEW